MTKIKLRPKPPPFTGVMFVDDENNNGRYNVKIIITSKVSKENKCIILVTE